jgi:hypothetical protein
LQYEINNISHGSIKNISYIDGPGDGDISGYGGWW